MKKIDLSSKIKIVVVSKALIEISLFLSMLSWKCIRLVDQEKSGQGQAIWATPLALLRNRATFFNLMWSLSDLVLTYFC